jgi:two-component system chemotaxis response regulator CheY
MLKNIISKIEQIEVIGEASNGVEAISLYKKLNPDLVTMDLVMPEKGGIEATEEILKINSKALIVVVSALGQEALVLEAAKKGAKDFIQKPFKTEQIIEVMDRILKNKQSEK